MLQLTAEPRLNDDLFDLRAAALLPNGDLGTELRLDGAAQLLRRRRLVGLCDGRDGAKPQRKQTEEWPG
ncbi:hypothetical protein GCM10023333_22530 [Ferrimonas pelagia]|uniref:Uncharacterized protein n=1 Tax=Ferrimonas pelagia TaxID=1177826 RepID=A0ABP9EWH7_9GAMM